MPQVDELIAPVKWMMCCLDMLASLFRIGSSTVCMGFPTEDCRACAASHRRDEWQGRPGSRRDERAAVLRRQASGVALSFLAGAFAGFFAGYARWRITIPLTHRPVALTQFA
ncbi:hypothetical protein VNPA120641_43200 [Pseudomonas aeruginosa]|nr:hypothetical protein VNPA120641_43200 [Pseudomonas aeruginosa]